MEFPETVTVHVLAEDITFGVKKDGNKCAIARAVKRHFGIDLGSDLVQVEPGYIILDVENDSYESIHYDMPNEAYDFIDAFDHDEPVQPFAFTANKYEYGEI